jgi:hypothetical protein
MQDCWGFVQGELKMEGHLGTIKPATKETEGEYIDDWMARQIRQCAAVALMVDLFDDLAWINGRMNTLWMRAQRGYDAVGRGVVAASMASGVTGGASAFSYLAEAAVAKLGDAETMRMMRAYDPREEFVIRLRRTGGGERNYQVRLPPKRRMR